MTNAEISSDDPTTWMPPLAPLAMPHQVLQVTSERPSVLQRILDPRLWVAARPV